MKTTTARMGRPVVILALAISLVSAADATFSLIGLAIDDPAVRDVVDQYTLFRDLQPIRYLGTARATDWLLDRPDLAAALARHLYPPVERYHVSMRDDGSFDVTDLHALRGSFRLVARGDHRRVYFCRGTFRSLSRILEITGEMVITLEYHDTRQGEDPAVEVASQLYVRLDNIVAHGVSKIVAPLLHKVIDRRVANLTAATQLIGERIARDPERLYGEMQAWTDLRPEDLAAFRKTILEERIAQ